MSISVKDDSSSHSSYLCRVMIIVLACTMAVRNAWADWPSRIQDLMPGVVSLSMENTVMHHVSIGQDKHDFGLTIPHTYSTVGSGIIVDADQGLILTNDHVIAHQHAIVATLTDGRRYYAKIEGRSPQLDIALLRIPANHLKAIRFANVPVKVGESIIAVGNPFGLNQTVTSGIISALHRSITTNPTDLVLGDFIQTDAPINPGNSGGALINQRGALVGMNTAIRTTSGGGNIGIGFAIPSTVLHPVCKQLLVHHHLNPGRIGILVQRLSPGLASALGKQGLRGVMIAKVEDHFPGKKADLRAEDVITQVDGQDIETPGQLAVISMIKGAGAQVKLRIYRRGQWVFRPVTLAPKKVSQPHERNQYLGLRLNESHWIDDRGHDAKGLEISGLSHSGLAWLSGLELHDLLLEADHQPLITLKHWQVLTSSKIKRSSMMLKIIRRGKPFYTVLTMPAMK